MGIVSQAFATLSGQPYNDPVVSTTPEPPTVSLPTEAQCRQTPTPMENVIPTLISGSPTATPSATPIATITGVEFTSTPTMSTVTPTPVVPADLRTPTPSIATPQGAPRAGKGGK